MYLATYDIAWNQSFAQNWYRQNLELSTDAYISLFIRLLAIFFSNETILLLYENVLKSILVSHYFSLFQPITILFILSVYYLYLYSNYICIHIIFFDHSIVAFYNFRSKSCNALESWIWAVFSDNKLYVFFLKTP